MERGIERSFLLITTFIGVVLLPFAIGKRPLKDWIIVYLVSCIGNSFADRLLVSKGYLKYKVRPFRKKLSIHLPFDYILYPLFLLYFNQWTLNSKPSAIILKLFAMTIPQVIIETIAAKKTDLITWKKGWGWQQSFVSLAIKFLMCRTIIACIRILNKKENSIT
ncbi:CBO0543 family protein [Halalkalibacter alkalisediminis]|uniref:CBO0543 family protein n=1 Tax=Halalkalibacter alkalisediminis TaxID=935616 RepID=A0ABV6NHI0_9BACI|nr:CBO0543 family protein [Halalkalibacter alkalisediminis]